MVGDGGLLLASASLYVPSVMTQAKPADIVVSNRLQKAAATTLSLVHVSWRRL